MIPHLGTSRKRIVLEVAALDEPPAHPALVLSQEHAAWRASPARTQLVNSSGADGRSTEARSCSPCARTRGRRARGWWGRQGGEFALEAYAPGVIDEEHPATTRLAE